MLQSDFRMRTQAESQVDGSSAYRNQSVPPSPRSTPSAVESGSMSMYSRGESAGYMSYQTSHLLVGNSPTTSGFRNVEERSTTVPNRHRMSLLHPPPQSLEYIMQQINPRPDRPSPQQSSGMYGSEGGMMKMVQMTESPPCKKLRLGDSKADIHLPLRIDTDRGRSGPAYNPQVEAISPTLPSESLRDESPLKSTKEELLQNISRVDREIAKTESQIAKLKKKKVELEELATQPHRETDDSTVTPDTVIRSLPQSLYAENRKKGIEAHQVLDKLGPRVDLPLYNQPSDTAVYQENKQKFLGFKHKLKNYFGIKLKEKNRREEYLTTTYTQLSAEWGRRLDKLENNSKRRNRDAKSRETFEKIFPELRKQREDKERFSRVGSRIKSDADMEEIMDGLQEQELENKKMRSYAVIPPILLDEVSRKRRFTNRNGLIEEPMQEYKDKQLINLWTDQEKDIFKEKYLQHPKNFGIIKSYLERKSVADCVQYYYMSKKAQNYRQLLRKNRARTRSSRNQQTSNSGTVNTSLPGLPSVVKTEGNGVTTRLQKEQKLDHPNGAVDSANQGPLETPMETNNIDPEASEGNFETEEGCLLPEAQLPIPVPPQLPIQSEFMCANKKKRKEDMKEALSELDTSDEENVELNGDKGIPHNCVVCKNRLDSYLQSRPLVRSQASQYGLAEEDVRPGDRVCTSCRCKAVRRRYKPNHCPIPTCPARRARIKRLRPFPPKWFESSIETKEAICSKYQIPPNVTKCCTACFNRINRRLMPNACLETPDDPSSDTSRWGEEEIETMKKALVEFGTDWRQLSEQIASKSDLQCRNFYFNFRKKHGLDALVQEFRKNKGVDGPPILTDEEESGSTTSSCDEDVSQDPSRNSLEKKDDYDSSATVSAEESVEPEKSHHGLEKLKTLPNIPNSDTPLQLTIRTTEGGNEANEMTRVQNQNSQVILHPVSGQSVMSMGMNTFPQPHYQRQQQEQPVSYQLSARESPSSAYHLHPSHHSGNSNQSDQMLQMPQQLHQHLHPTLRHTSPEVNESHEPMTVKDLMLATIERQLRKNPVVTQQQSNHNQSIQHIGPIQSLSPTIQSILKSQERSHLPPPSGQSPIVISGGQQLNVTPINHHHPNISHASSQFQHHPVYYSAKGGDMRALPQQHMVVREIIPVVQIQHASAQAPRDDYETLDLSMKKRTPSPQVAAQRPPSSGSLPPPAHQPMDFANRQEVYYPKYPVNRSRQPQPQMSQMKPSSKVLPPLPLLTKPPTVSPHSSMKDGSITHGTPLQMSHQHPLPSKYEGLLKPMKEGSITHGTPLDKVRGKDQSSSPYMYDRSPDNYKRMSPASYGFHGSHPQMYNQKSPSGHRSPPISVPHTSTYSTDQHNTSRQIIINDYYTSQQMQQPPPHIQASLQNQQRMELTKRGPPPPQNPPHHGHPVYILPPRNEHPYRQSPTPPQHHQQQRQGVIHRTNPNRPGPVVKQDPGRYQQQHDAFASLVDIAAAQPSLPVPKDDPRPRLGLPRVDVVREGLGKSMVDMERNRLTMPPHPQVTAQRGTNHPISIMQNMHDASRNRKEVEARYTREGQDATLTAASLIDAIITHQINQPSVHDRQSPIPTRTGDRLFASFQRCVQPSGMMQQQSHMSLNRPQQMDRVQHGEEIRMDEGHVMDHRNPQGGTWGDHIDLIISKDYASRKGTILGHSNTGLQKVTVPVSLPVQQQYTAPHPKAQEDVGPYISWKLRRALQHEKEQQQQQIVSHPDERHIIRVVQVDQSQQLPQHSTPPSVPSSKESNFNYSVESAIDMKEPMERDHHGSRNKPREGMSPLDYVKNRIVEVMRTENNEDKGEEANSESMISNSGSTVPVKPSTSSCSIVSSTNNSINSTISAVVAAESNSENHGEPGKEENVKNESIPRPGTESPTPMVIDESGAGTDERGKSPLTEPPTSSTSMSKSHLNYEPLTDEECV